MLETLLLPDLREMISSTDERGLHEFCEAFYPGVTASILAHLTPEEISQVLANCHVSRRAEILPFLPIEMQVDIVEHMDRTELSRLIEEMAADDRVDLLEQMEPEAVENLLPLVAQAERRDIRKLLSYPDESAGSIMTTDYASLPKNITVKEALAKLRLQAPNRETIYYIYVIDDERHLLGFVSLRNLILANPETRLADIMQRDMISVKVDDDQEDVANVINRYDFIAIPVVDQDNRLVGIVTHDDAVDVLHYEAQEDQERLVGVQPLEESYLSEPIFMLARKRVVWLIGLLFAAILTASIFEYLHKAGGNGQPVGMIDRILMFLPLVLACGGNAGSQSAALVISYLSALDREIKKFSLRDFWKIMGRELIVGSLIGLTLATFAFILSFLLLQLMGPPAVVSGTVFIVVMISTSLGALLPIIFHHFGSDPALMSTPLIAAIMDMIGVVILFNIARLM